MPLIFDKSKKKKMIDNNDEYEHLEMDHNIEESDYDDAEGGGENDENLSDIRLVVGLNYFKLKDQKIYFLPYEISFQIFDWKNPKKELLLSEYQAYQKKELFLYGHQGYQSFSTIYNKTSVDSSLTDVEEQVNVQEKAITYIIKDLINVYKIKHVYVYGNNIIIRRLFKTIDVNVYNIKDISPSCTPTPIDLISNRKISNLKKKHQCYDHYFREINDVVMKISRIFYLGYDHNKMALNWENVNGHSALQNFIGREKTVVEIRNYIISDELCRMNIFSLALLRRALEKDMNNCNSLDIEAKAKAVSYLLKIIYLCFVKPNYFKWNENIFTNNDVSKQILTFTITGPRKIYPVEYNSYSDFSITMDKELEEFIDEQMLNEYYSRDQINYENNNLYINLLQYSEVVMFD